MSIYIIKNITSLQILNRLTVQRIEYIHNKNIFENIKSDENIFIQNGSYLSLEENDNFIKKSPIDVIPPLVKDDVAIMPLGCWCYIRITIL